MKRDLRNETRILQNYVESAVEDNDQILTKVLDKPDLRSEVKSKSKSKSRSKCRGIMIYMII